MYASNTCCNRNLFYCEKCCQNERDESASEEEDYTRQKKHENKKMSGPVTVYWLIATAIYLAWSFTTND